MTACRLCATGPTARAAVQLLPRACLCLFESSLELLLFRLFVLFRGLPLAPFFFFLLSISFFSLLLLCYDGRITVSQIFGSFSFFPVCMNIMVVDAVMRSSFGVALHSECSDLRESDVPEWRECEGRFAR